MKCVCEGGKLKCFIDVYDMQWTDIDAIVLYSIVNKAVIKIYTCEESFEALYMYPRFWVLKKSSEGKRVVEVWL